MFDQFRNKFRLDDEKWNRYINYFNKMKVPAKTVLLNEGEISKKLFFIEKGCIRVCFNHDGKDITSQFFFEESVVASIESFRKNIPSPTTLETIETTTLWWIQKDDLNQMLEEIKEIPYLRDMFIDKIFERTFDYMKYFISSIKYTPQQRYLDLIRERPEIIQRVPQHYIASYLGITTVHLSRIKNKLLKNKE
ncbi:Crp/Fnr family transcriptional regulator [Elizabethkingia anophelis]|uniref:Crp/Fnr family transcriptional regulator n=1 Tax=Elizabethkingia anophelis TaxID=1117645 RepID=UPI000C9A95E4|nr:Crp/Fnr family transcriptional regulator [Elizabethkingia anophelis]MCT3758531.1 Crp/Fnr family transcriptional regulator [Elizabethkingia anophelis]MCT3971821.1 Crp/Fnr family transcriptional regulator [Elizabethkingia anophelis]MCT4000286.1 Crp/Fnr family transcriptional regulator [Elizabethkingia anophelis]MCT4014733.1 Crp/Fnr family transcriptional regulator [Elizabethkingia anophelis]MCT4018294.1 Crp/Fnr family transcriptional regulator [Elizabethkingia anophelis]